MNIEKYLPIGTVLKLKEAEKSIMIIGYCPITNEGKNFDYAACMYPEGVLSPKETLLFNHDEICEVIYKGLESEEYKNFNDKLIEIIGKIEKGIDPTETNKEIMEVLPVEEV